jgi:hypothetical protein
MNYFLESNDSSESFVNLKDFSKQNTRINADDSVTN